MAFSALKDASILLIWSMMKLTIFYPKTWPAFFKSTSSILAFHHTLLGICTTSLNFCNVRVVSLTCLRSFSRFASNFCTCSAVYRFSAVRWSTLRSSSRNRRGSWMASCTAATKLSCGGLPTTCPVHRIWSLYSVIRDRTPSKSRIMASTRLSSSVKVEVPPPTSLVADLVRAGRFSNISFRFLVKVRFSLLKSAMSSSFEPS